MSYFRKIFGHSREADYADHIIIGPLILKKNKLIQESENSSTFDEAAPETNSEIESIKDKIHDKIVDDRRNLLNLSAAIFGVASTFVFSVFGSVFSYKTIKLSADANRPYLGLEVNFNKNYSDIRKGTPSFNYYYPEFEVRVQNVGGSVAESVDLSYVIVGEDFKKLYTQDISGGSLANPLLMGSGVKAQSTIPYPVSNIFNKNIFFKIAYTDARTAEKYIQLYFFKLEVFDGVLKFNYDSIDNTKQLKEKVINNELELFNHANDQQGK